MPMSPELDKQIRQRFEELEKEAQRLTDLIDKDPYLSSVNGGKYTSDFNRVKTNFLNLIDRLVTKKNSFAVLIKNVQGTIENTPSELHGMIAGLKSDYESGMLRSIAEMIESNVVADYLTQAEQLLKGNTKGVHTYGPAAVLLGAILEDGLCRLCSRQNPPVSTHKSNGEPKTMSTLIDDLKGANVFNELKAKQLRAWAGVRNAAAHGQFNDFTESDVEQMMKGVQMFLADYL